MKFLYPFIVLCYATICFAENIDSFEKRGINCNGKLISDDLLKLKTIRTFTKLHNEKNNFYQIDYSSIRQGEKYPDTYHLQFRLAQCPRDSFPFSVNFVCLPDNTLLGIAVNIEVNCE